MFRLCFLTFFGQPRDQHRYEHSHESPRVMTWPLIFLGFLSIFAGWVALPWLPHGYASFVFFGEVHHAHPNYLMMLIGTIVAVSGIFLAYLMYYKKSLSPEKIGQTFKPVYTLLYNKYYFDELYDAVLIRPVMKLGDFLWSFDARVVDGLVNLVGWLTVVWADLKQLFDQYVVDGAVNGAGWVVRSTGGILRYLQTGRLQFYALFIVITIVLIGLYKFEISRIEISWPILTAIFVIGAVVLMVLSRAIGARQKPAPTSESEE
jgi:NADH-quinone oxidoreductase subunit L